MFLYRQYLIGILVLSLCSYCQPAEKDNIIPDPDTIYFPPLDDDIWETISPLELDWNEGAIADLDEFMQQTATRALLILKNGKMVIEKYQGLDLLGGSFDLSDRWYWASAGKTLTSALVGIAQQEDYLDIGESSQVYLGAGWSSMTREQEQQIKIVHHLNMTTGLETQGVDIHCTEPECLHFRTAPGTRWYYHNAPYTILDRIISEATQQDFDSYFNSKLRDVIGMDGYWLDIDFNHVFFSTARSMARYGILIANGGFWEEREIIDPSYVQEMITPSQLLNKSYGYLWWLNGQSSYLLPGSTYEFHGNITPAAPNEAYAAIGKNGQILYIVPSEGLILIRMGEDPDDALVSTQFANDLWTQINKIIYP